MGEQRWESAELARQGESVPNVFLMGSRSREFDSSVTGGCVLWALPDCTADSFSPDHLIPFEPTLQASIESPKVFTRLVSA